MLRSAQRYLVPGVIVALYYSLRFGCGVSPKALVQLSSKIRIGKGTLIKPFAVDTDQRGRITIGAHCAINNFVLISTFEADVTLGDYVRIGPRHDPRGCPELCAQGPTGRGPGLSAAGGTRIGRDVLIGAGAVIFDCTIGDGAVIGAGAVVTKDVGPYQVVTGVPAQVVDERR